MTFEEHKHFGCRGTGFCSSVEFQDIPSIDPAPESDPVRGVVWSGENRLKSDSIEGEIFQDQPLKRMA